MLTALRRTIVALSLAGVAAAYLRLNSPDDTPPSEGGWRELSGPELD